MIKKLHPALSKVLGCFQPKLGCFPTQRWLHSGQITCWVKLTQHVGSVILPSQLGCFVYLTYKLGRSENRKRLSPSPGFEPARFGL